VQPVPSVEGLLHQQSFARRAEFSRLFHSRWLCHWWLLDASINENSCQIRQGRAQYLPIPCGIAPDELQQEKSAKVNLETKQL
jgi:hypothetical protein